MAFFPRTLYDNDASFTPLFRLLDDFDSYSRQGQNGRSRGIPHWQPKFDVRETEDAYELHGELPGIKKEDVQIEFTEPQAILIRGRTERTYTSGTPPAGLVEDSNKAGAIEGGEKSEEQKKAHKATVEDEKDAESKTKNDSQEVSKTNNQQDVQKKSGDQAKYWLTERSIGEFSRTFNFPTRVDHDHVTANFKDGILSITVPKAKKHESRRIAVN